MRTCASCRSTSASAGWSGCSSAAAASCTAWCGSATTSRAAAAPCSRRPACSGSRASCPSAPTARYAGRRTRSWLKTKCGRRQEFVVGGFTEPSGARRGFGALLLGVYDEEGALRYAGRVGSGFDDATLARLHARLKKLETGDAGLRRPAARRAGPRRALDGAAARRRGGLHRVDRRRPAAPPRLQGPARGQGAGGRGAGARGRRPGGRGRGRRQTAGAGSRPGAGRIARRSRQPRPPPARRSRAALRRSAGKPVVGGVAISHPDRVVFPDPGLTKLDVVRYYEAVAGLMVPYLAQRALTVIRCPDGIGSAVLLPEARHAVGPALGGQGARARRRQGEGRRLPGRGHAPKACWPWSRTAPWSSTSGGRG